MNLRAILNATAEAKGELVLPDGCTITNGDCKARHSTPGWLIYTPQGREIHFARDPSADAIRYPTWQEALTEWEQLTNE